MTSFKAALFDLDGTLFDTEGQYSILWGAIGKEYHPEIEGFENLIKGTTLTQILSRYFPDPAVQQEVVKKLDAYEAQMNYQFYPGALEFLHDLKRNGVKCAVVTSSNIPKMQSVVKALPEFGTLFDRILTAEDFSASKPNPDCYLLGAKVFGCTIGECVVFEDALTGLQAGMSSGIFTIGLATTNPREVIAERCNYVLDGFEGVTYRTILDILKKAEH